MKKIQIEIKLIIEFYDSFFFGGGIGTGEIQSCLLRDINGFPYISGAALKGCIAEYAASLSRLVPAFNNGDKLFGIGGVQQGSLYFENGNLVHMSKYNDIKENLMELRTGVSINPYTKAKKEGQLYTMELSGMGGEMIFQSSICGFMDVDTYQKDISHIIAAVRMIFALGGRRSAGLGWLRSPIQCKVFKEIGVSGELKKEVIDSEYINQWIKDWIGGIACTK
ncbi:MAG: hypothetical protein HFH65_01305 [Lachnospiraceae bacterium]|nr:hypothetical protein [Lachnospiraceae bacterium]